MMKLRFTIVAVIIVNVSTIFGQKPPSFNPDDINYDIDPIVCPAGIGYSDHHIPAPKSKISPYKKMELDMRAIYDDQDNVPLEVRTAIEERVFPLLKEVFSSPVPIIVFINWEQTGVGTLASASPEFFVPNFESHVPIFNVWYPGPLAEKIARREINDPGEPDIEITINQNIDWCYDCNTPAEVGPERFDFVSILLHEFYHGLGFFAFASVDDNTGLATQRSQGISATMNNFMELRDGTRTILLDDGSQELLNHFQSNQLFFNLPEAGKVKLFAPNPYERGSSISHLDEATYSGGNNELMTPSSQRGEVERSAGIANDIMYDMGWTFTYLLHEPADLTVEKSIDQDYIVSIDIISDNGFMEDSLLLHYSTDEFTSEDIIATFTKVDEDTYQSIIPATNERKIVDYYMEVVDNRGLRYSNPGVNFDGLQFTNQYAFGPDEFDPILAHDPVESIKAVDVTLNLFANSNDVFAGVDTVFVEWQINEVAQAAVGMMLDTADLFEDDRYIAALPIPSGLDENDILEYRIISIDASSIMNTTISPATGFHKVEIVPVSNAIDLYNNNFNSVTDDFEGNGFSISQPVGFASPCLHTDHFYQNAGENRTLNFIYELKAPVILAERGRATMLFDEIVLVEPGDPGTRFGDQNFWDYVIVEGKKFGSSGWRPFLDGYDSFADPAWFTAYNNAIPNGGQDSDRVGTPDLFRPKRIDLLESGEFNSGDTVIVRFRLFSDPFAIGWGWAIDNLTIQDRSVPVEDFILEQNFVLIPNPAGPEVNVALDLESVSNRISISLIDIMGRLIMVDHINDPDQRIRRTYSLNGLDDGIYLVNVTFDNKETITKKLVVKN